MTAFHFEQIDHPRYKYRQLDKVVDHGNVGVPGSFKNEYIELKAGCLKTFEGYCWDGPSGPAIDTVTFMRGSLVHDALYQLMRLGVFDRREWRKQCDKVMRRINIEDGMSKARAWWTYAAVRIGAGASAKGE